MTYEQLQTLILSASNSQLIQGVALRQGYLDVLRLDRVHPDLSGNKLFKLIGHLQAFNRSNAHSILTFGGRWSNHLHALAHVGKALNISVILMVRGYQEQADTATLADCRALGARILFCDRATYARRYDDEWLRVLAEQHQAYVIAEGGAGELGKIGFASLKPRLEGYQHIWLAAGTGTTAEAIGGMLRSQQTLHVVNCVSDQGELQRRWSANPFCDQWKLVEATSGRFGQCSQEILDCIRRFDALDLPLEPVYTAKVMLAILKSLDKESPLSCLEISETHFDPNPSASLFIHTGGLQGRRGYSLN